MQPSLSQRIATLLSQGLTLSEVSDPITLDEIFSLRVTAWRTRVDMPVDMEQWSDKANSGGRHWAVFKDRTPIASARLSIHWIASDLPDFETYLSNLPVLPLPIGSINRCVVHPAYRRRGLATLLDEIRIDAARQCGCRSIACSADDERRLRQLQALGFKTIGNGNSYQHGPLVGVEPTILTMLL